jgi:hypothetical protein
MQNSNNKKDFFHFLINTANKLCDADCLNTSRKQNNVIARAFVYSELRKRGFILEEIASLFNKNYSTVGIALQKHAVFLEFDKKYAMLSNSFNNIIESKRPTVDLNVLSVKKRILNFVVELRKMSFTEYQIQELFKECYQEIFSAINQ